MFRLRWLSEDDTISLHVKCTYIFGSMEPLWCWRTGAVFIFLKEFYCSGRFGTNVERKSSSLTNCIFLLPSDINVKALFILLP